MSIEEVASSLLRAEETFSACLARINTVVLKPLLQSGSFENIKVFLLLNDHFQVIWHLTEENDRTLRQIYGASESVSLPDVYLVWKADAFLNAYIQYFFAFATCVVVRGFEDVARIKSEVWKLCRSSLQEFLADFSRDTSMAVALHTVLQKPFQDHLQQYSFVLSRLKKAAGQGLEKEKIADASEKFAKLRSFASQVLDEACLTASLWKSLGSKFTDVLCTPERRLLEDSQNLSIFASIGRIDRILLFNDALVLIQGNSFQSFDLKLLWVDATSRETGQYAMQGCPQSMVKKVKMTVTAVRLKLHLFHVRGGHLDFFDHTLGHPDGVHAFIAGHTLRIVAPEEEFFLLTKEPESRAVWQWKTNRAVCQALVGKTDLPLWGDAGKGFEPPLCRFATFAFKAEGRFKNATYQGEWCLGKPHGKGTLTWPNGQNYVGDFKAGLENGFGICLIPQGSKDCYDCYKCHWREGRMNGYGICEYGNEMVYKGYFKDNMRQGFGVLDSPPATGHPFKYTGHWKKDKKTGYGVWDDKERGERYIGMWESDQRHGPGIVVMQSGVCFRRMFHLDKMVGSGVLLLEDNSVFEGNFTNNLSFVGKGKLTFSNGFVLEGVFTNKPRRGLQMQGILNSSGDQLPVTKVAVQLGQEDFPVERRWEDLYDQFLGFIRAGGQGETEEFFMGFHVQTSRELRKSQEHLFCHRGTEEASKETDFLEELVTRQEPEARQRHLRQSLESSLHPLGKLLKALTLVFQSTYSGIGANKHLLSMAQEEVKHYAKKIWEFYQGLLQLAFKVKGHTSPQDTEQRGPDGGCLMLPLILPSFYPELLMLYMVSHEQQDQVYCQGIVQLSCLSDMKLLEYLDVQKHFWPLKDLTLTNNQRESLVKDHCFLSATECLQKLITTVDPQEKLDILQRTYEEIEKTINRLLGKEYNLPMDDLLPLLAYVVTRASIQHLGAEIHLIRDLMDPTNEGGRHDFLLTALESCYQLIQELKLHQNW